jgi:hypothetical protein
MSANFPSISATRINRHWGLATLGCILATILWFSITDVPSSISAWNSTWTESATLAQHGIPRVCPDAQPPPILVIPVNARSAGPRMCKTLLAALVHGYSPVIINWESDKSGGAAQLEKVEAMHTFLQTPRSTTGALISDESLVFMIDGLDVWLQLPAPHLVARFRELVPVDQEGLSLKVVIGSDKKCWPNDQNGVSAVALVNQRLLAHVARRKPAKVSQTRPSRVARLVPSTDPSRWCPAPAPRTSLTFAFPAHDLDGPIRARLWAKRRICVSSTRI